MKRVWIFCLASPLAIGVLAMADPTTQPMATSPVSAAGPSELSALNGRPDETPATQPSLGPIFSSQATGISLRPPYGGKMYNRVGGEVIVEFVNEAKKTTLRVTHSSFSNPVPLTVPPLVNQAAPAQKGLLEMTASQLTARMPNSSILRQDVMPIATFNAGMIMLRAANGVQNQFIQQAIIQANEQSYYNITYSTPGEPFNAPANQPSATELEAVKIFQAVLDTVQITDLEKLRADQEDRLYRTRSLLVNWTEAKIRSVLVPEQWLRVIRDGKDVGYSYVVEETETRATEPGVKIGIRSRNVPEAGKQIDGETWYHVSFDRKVENWSSIWLYTGGDDKYHATEFGSSEQRRKAVPDPTAVEKLQKGDNVGVKQVDVYTLSVHRMSKRVTAPDVERELPPFYLPEGLGHLLPRLLPTNEPRGYLFASYVSGDAEVKLRYIDVGVLTDVNLNGQKVTAFPITDRYGYDGAITTHYVDPNGKYLGSKSIVISDTGAQSTVLVLPTDQATLTGLWGNPTLSRPAENPVVPRD